jgi:hypothetical protein
MKTFRRTTSESISEQVLASLRDGNTTRMVAQRLNLPMDFIELIHDQAISSRQLAVLDFAGQQCSSTHCNPDPESFVCAGCPVMSISKRRTSARKNGFQKLLSTAKTLRSNRNKR